MAAGGYRQAEAQGLQFSCPDYIVGLRRWAPACLVW